MRIFLTLAAALLLSGCLTSDHPLPDSGEAGPNSPLIGYWYRSVEDDGKETYEVLTVFPSEKIPGRLAVIESLGRAFEPKDAAVAQETKETDVYDFYLSRVGERTFVNLLDRSPENRKYIIMRYSYDGANRLDIWNISDKFAEAAEKSLQGSAKTGFQAGFSELDQAAQLTRMVEALTDEDFDKPAEYTRWTQDAAALNAMMASVAQ